MSDKNESFEDWRKDYWSRKGMSTDTTHRFLMAEALDAWNHQQKKIDELEYYKQQWQSIAGKANLKNLVKQANKLQAAEEENKILREAVEFIASDDDDIDMIIGSWAVRTARQALEKVSKE